MFGWPAEGRRPNRIRSGRPRSGPAYSGSILQPLPLGPSRPKLALNFRQALGWVLSSTAPSGPEVALVECYECGGSVSSLATQCPHRGAPVRQQPKPAGSRRVRPRRTSQDQAGTGLIGTLGWLTGWVIYTWPGRIAFVVGFLGLSMISQWSSSTPSLSPTRPDSALANEPPVSAPVARFRDAQELQRRFDGSKVANWHVQILRTGWILRHPPR